jgi:hypothetical protein
VLWESSSAVLWDSSRAELWRSSRAELWGSSSTELWDSSRAVLWGSSSAELRKSSSAVLRDSSRAELWDSSRAELRGSSRAELNDASHARVYSGQNVTARDYSCVVAHQEKTVIKEHDTVTISVIPVNYQASFEDTLKRGYVRADGITKKLKKKTKKKGIDIFTVEEFSGGESFVVKKGDKFAHGKTVKAALTDLRYKISDRDTSRFSGWKPSDTKSIEDLIEAYRVITGACEFGVKSFCAGKKLKSKYKVSEAIKLVGDSFGADKFKGFFEGGNK